MNKKLLSLYGLKWNPFSPEVPIEALYVSPRHEDFLWRLENGLVREGGFALITGEPGTGKSVVLRLLDQRLSRLPDVTIAPLERPQSNLADFYREMGDLFGLPIRPHNRWYGFRILRECFLKHIENTLVRPVLLVDEAQDVNPDLLKELRGLSSHKLDSRLLLTIILAGDARLAHKLDHPDFLPIQNRLRARLTLDYLPPPELRAYLEHLLDAAGSPSLMTPELIATVCDHSLGNPRTMVNLGAQLLTAAAQREAAQLDEKLYLELFGPGQNRPSKPRGRGHRRGA